MSEDVLFVSMPWASARYPSLAFGILAPLVKSIGLTVDVRYFNVEFSELIGNDLYEELSQEQYLAVGEQAFAEILHPQRRKDPRFRAFIEQRCDWEEFDHLTGAARELAATATAEILRRRPRMLGLTTTFYQKIASLVVARLVKAHAPETVVLMGGAGCELPIGAELMRSFPFVDFVFSGETERTLPAFFESHFEGESVENVPGLSFRDGKGEVRTGPKNAIERGGLETFAPDHEPFVRTLRDLGIEGRDDWILSYEASRGCWWGQKHHCTFCGLNGNQMAYRIRPADQVLNDLRAIRKTFGPRTIQFTDNILPHDAVRRLLPGLEQVEDQTYFMEVKANLEEADLSAMARAGVKEIQPGIERFSDEALGLMKKGTTSLQNVQTLRIGTEYGLIVTWNLLWGFAGETEEAVEQEIELLRKLRHLRPPGSSGRVRLDRFSPNFEDAERLGYRVTGASRAEAWMFHGSEAPEALAYHFAFEYVIKPSPRLEELWSELDRVAREWRKDFVPGQLVQFREKEAIVIEDRRSGGEQELVLEGLAAEVLDFCSRIRPLHALRERFLGCDAVIEQLEQEGILLRQGQRALSLAPRDGSMLPSYPRSGAPPSPVVA